ncbi:phospholipase A1 VesT1.02-like [Culicoides brevitarsis]|uniref:phospholipase A1 VesT1.02-like n=1 Tax=Culicoides brevitarsis TaxID=469753 RepID=UPI00307B78DD
MIKFVLLSVFLAQFVAAGPIEEDHGPKLEEVNKYLYGEPHPEWLKYVDDEGKFDPKLLPKSKARTIVGDLIMPAFDAEKKVKFWLYTKKEPVRRQILLEDLESLKESTFDPTHPIRFLVHGWQNDETSDMIQMIKDAYLKKADFNIFVIDWGKGASSINYYGSRHRVGDVAEVATRFIQFLITNFNVKTKDIQMIGHSLGAHICGLTGKNFEDDKISVIVGLDPASPLFSVKKYYNRLDVDDAEYVEVIHTAAGSLGFDEPIGTADFYPNFGRSQPGCGWDLTGACAHSRAYEYFTESILSDVGFWSNQCGDYSTEIKKEKCSPTGAVVTLGGDPLHVMRAVGNYHLETNKNAPYALGLTENILRN